MLYGFGSKKDLLEDFARKTLTDGGVVVANGFFPGISAKQILIAAAAAVTATRKGEREAAMGTSNDALFRRIAAATRDPSAATRPRPVVAPVAPGTRPANANGGVPNGGGGVVLTNGESRDGGGGGPRDVPQSGRRLGWERDYSPRERNPRSPPRSTRPRREAAERAADAVARTAAGGSRRASAGARREAFSTLRTHRTLWRWAIPAAISARLGVCTSSFTTSTARRSVRPRRRRFSASSRRCLASTWCAAWTT